MITCIGTVVLTLGLGVIDHPGWRERFGYGVGSVEIAAPVLCGESSELQLSAYHVSSIEDDNDRGVNTFEIKYRMEFGR